MLKALQEHGKQQKRQLQNIVRRDITQVYRIERIAIRHVKIDIEKVVKYFEEKLEIKDEV